MSKQKIIVIVGPTASGKSALGVYMAQKLGGEVISADSRQVYRGLDIGTGKVTKKEMQGTPHHMLDIVSPKKIYTASDFKKDAEKALSKISANNTLPIIVGGTGLYIDVLLGRVVLPDVPPNEKLRARLEKKPVEQLLKMLQEKDPARAKTIEPKHKRRIIRALEIAEFNVRSQNNLATKRSHISRSESKTWPSGPERSSGRNVAELDILWLGINPTEKILHKNIHTRLLARLKTGMIAEAKRLHAKGLSYKRMEQLGLEYRYMARLLQHKITKEEFVIELEREIQKYAKRQLRWFIRNKDIHWIKNSPKSRAGTSEALKIARLWQN